MIAIEFKKSVLQAAIQGKLTSQLTEDGDSRDLLRDILNEKLYLIKNRKIKKTNLIDYTAESDVPFVIPSNWCWVRLGEISKSITAGGDKPSNFSAFKTEKMKIPVIANGKSNKGVLGYTDRASVYDSCITVSGRGTIGYSCVRTEPFFPIVRLLTVIPLTGINLSYLEYVLTSLLEVGVGTSIQQLTVPMIYRKLIPLPPASEQARIVQQLEKIFPTIDDLQFDEKTMEELYREFPNKIKDSILLHAIQGKLTDQLPEDGNAKDLLLDIQNDKLQLVMDGKIKKNSIFATPTEEETPFDIPESWLWTTLSKCYSLLTLNDGDWILSDDMTSKNEVKLIQLGSIGVGKFIEKDYKYISYKKFDELKCSLIYPGYLLINRMIGNGFFSCIIPSNIEGKLITSVDACWIAPIKQINQNYLMYVLASPYFKAEVSKLGAGTTRVRISKGNLIEILFPLPPLSEQQRIVKRIEEILPLIESI